MVDLDPVEVVGGIIVEDPGGKVELDKAEVDEAVFVDDGERVSFVGVEVEGTVGDGNEEVVDELPWVVEAFTGEVVPIDGEEDVE
ncbi:hypothetical protein Q1695_013345 [Nippostrongylus brasiliensis]|nr:hypothetical protein Q1695_013345 [Nippostrongylus brasiliensis]